MKTKTGFMVLFLSAFSMVPAARALTVEAKGKVFYKLPDGQISVQEAVLGVPSRGEGDLTLKSGTELIKAHARKSVRKNGRTVFSVLFLNPREGAKSTATVFRGTYTRGSNKALYYGDIYTGTDLPLTELNRFAEESPRENWVYKGGFFFSSPVPSPSASPSESLE